MPSSSDSANDNQADLEALLLILVVVLCLAIAVISYHFSGASNTTVLCTMLAATAIWARYRLFEKQSASQKPSSFWERPYGFTLFIADISLLGSWLLFIIYSLLKGLLSIWLVVDTIPFLVILIGVCIYRFALVRRNTDMTK